MIHITIFKCLALAKLSLLKLANWLKRSGSALLCLRRLVLIIGKYNWGDGDEAYGQ